MRNVFRMQPWWAIAVFCAGIFFFPSVTHASIFTVNDPEDTNDGTCVHPYVDSTTDCTLREAINAANAHGGSDTIIFSVAAAFLGTAYDDGDGQYTTTLASAYSALTGPTIIDASNAWDTDDDRPGFKLFRNSDADAALLFTGIGATGSRVSGLEFEGHLRAVGITTPSMTVGTNCDGANDARERNVMYGAATDEILVNNVSGNILRGNYIGVRSDGITASTFGVSGITVTGASADNTVIGYVEGTSGTCSAIVQRNVIGGGDSSLDTGINVTSGTIAINGDSASAPNGTVIAGNYIGIGSDGSTDIGGLGAGVQMTNAATLNWIGTDGDGTDDALEGNVISGWSVHGILILNTGYNRVSGNIIGFNAAASVAQGNGADGILARGIGSIIGWCPASLNGTLCSDGGSAANEANLVGNNGDDGIRLGAGCTSCVVAGNLIGTAGGGGTDFGNAFNGIFVHRGNTNVVIGGSVAEAANVVKYNGIGILVDGYFSGLPFVSGPTEGYLIEGNSVSTNDGIGIKILGTEQDGTLGPSDGTVTNNTVSGNGRAGIALWGSSPTVSTNTITLNTGNAIDIQTEYRHDESTVDSAVYGSAYDALAPANAAGDSVAQPSITGNTINGNGQGIYILDAKPQNISTLAADNTIGTNGTYDVRRDWYAALEFFDPEHLPLTSGSLHAFLTPANLLSCSANCAVRGVADAGSGQAIWGPTMFVSYTDASSWFILTDYLIGVDGTRNDYNPYTVHVIGAAHATVRINVDGDMSDSTQTGVLPLGITTAGVDRYQLFEIPTVFSRVMVPSVAAPLAGAPIVMGSDTIRWIFTDQALHETGFSLLARDTQGERTVADTGPVSATDLAYFDETGLTPNTEYCGRYVVAYRDTQFSSPVALPCARTLVGEEEEEVSAGTMEAIPSLQVTSAFFLVRQGEVLAVGVLLASWVGAGVVMPVFSKRRKRQSFPDLFWVRLGQMVIGGAVVFFAWRLFTPTTVGADGLLTPITKDTVIVVGDTVRFTFEIKNLTDIAAQEVTLRIPIPAEFIPDATTVHAQRDGERLPYLLSVSSLKIKVGSLPAQGDVTVSFDAQALAYGVPEVTAFLHQKGAKDVVMDPEYLQVKTAVLQSPFQTQYHPLSVVRTASDPALYFIDTDGSRRLFSDATTYHTWFTSSKNVRDISEEDMQSIPSAAVMGIRPGTLLVKKTGNPTVYAVEPGKHLRPLPSEAYAQRLYGMGWSKLVVDIPLSQFTQYAVRRVLNEENFPDGLLMTDGNTRCYVLANTCRTITANGWKANRFSEEFLRTVDASWLGTLPQQNPITQTEATLLFD